MIQISNKRLTFCLTLLFGLCLFAYFSILKDYDTFRSVFVKLWFCFNFFTALTICVVDIIPVDKLETKFSKACYQILMFILCGISFVLSLKLLLSLLPDRGGNLWLNSLDLYTTLPHVLQEFANIFIHLLLIYRTVCDVNLNLLLICARIRSTFLIICLVFNFGAMVTIQFTISSQLIFSEIFMSYILVERSALFLLTGDEFNCNTKSKLVRKAQTISLFIGKYMGLIRFAANTFMTIKNELCRLAATNEHVEELNDLKRRLFGYYSREFSTFVPAIIAIIILTLFHDSCLKVQIDPGRFKKNHIHVIEMTLDRLAEDNQENHDD